MIEEGFKKASGLTLLVVWGVILILCLLVWVGAISLWLSSLIWG